MSVWKTAKAQKVQKELQRASEYEARLLSAQTRCSEMLEDEQLTGTPKRRNVQRIETEALNVEAYRDAARLTQLINGLTQQLAVEWPAQLDAAALSDYGQMVERSGHTAVSVPALTLQPPHISRVSKSGYKLDLQWTSDRPLEADKFMIRCLTGEEADDGDEDEKSAASGDGRWKSLIFAMKESNAEGTRFSVDGGDLSGVFLLDKAYRIRIEYHVTDPVNLLIASNEQRVRREAVEPAAAKADLVELEYAAHRGSAYEGHPKGLLLEGKKSTCTYRSRPNADFDYKEHDWLVFKLKHSGASITYLPKACVVRNSAGIQAVKEVLVSIGPQADGKEWWPYEPLELKSGCDEYQRCWLKGVDWKHVKEMKQQYVKLELVKNFGENRGKQCRFKFHEFRLYGLEL